MKSLLLSNSTATGQRRRRLSRTAAGLAVAVALAMVFSAGVTSSRRDAAAAATSSASSLGPGTIATMVISGGGGLKGGVPGNGSPGGHGSTSIEVNSWSWGATNSGSSSTHGGGGRGKISISDFNIMKAIDKATPILFQACASGESVGTVLVYFDVPDATGAMTTYETITLDNARVSKCTISSSSGGSGGDRPTESLSFNFTKVQMDWTGPQGSQPTHFSWDLATNKKA